MINKLNLNLISDLTNTKRMCYVKKRYMLIFGLVAVLVLAGCQAANTPDPQVSVTDIQITTEPGSSTTGGKATKAPIPTLEPYTFKTSEAGTVTLHGMLAVMDPTSILPGPDDAIFLVPMNDAGPGATTIPQFTVGEVPQADVDERTGEFTFQNIQPGRYAVVVLTKGGSQIPAKMLDDGSLAIITVDKSSLDQTMELGTLRLP